MKENAIDAAAVLVLTDIACRIFPVEGFNQPWVPFHNLGAWVNIKIEGVEKTSIWAFFFHGVVGLGRYFGDVPGVETATESVGPVAAG